jgi:hypothetical protein
MDRMAVKEPKPRERNPILDAWHDTMGTWPNTVQRQELETLITDIPLFKECLRVWRLRGFSPMNATGVIEWYKAGGPPKHNGKVTVQSDYGADVCPQCHRSPCHCDGVDTRSDDVALINAWQYKRYELQTAGIMPFFEGAKPIGRDADGRLIIVPTDTMREKMTNTHPSMSGRIANILRTAQEMGVIVGG